MKQFNYTKKSKFFAIISLVAILIGVVGLIVNGGLKYGIDFTGGTNIQIDMQGKEYNADEMAALVSEVLEGKEVQVQSMSDGKYAVVKTEALSNYLEEGEETQVDEVFSAIEEKYEIEIPEGDRNVTTIGESTSKKILTGAMYATLLAVALMLLYITIRFEFLSGVAAVAGLAHNIVIMIGFYAIMGLPINNSFVAAVLTIVGYSINNTIVIFDRVRENVKKEKSLSYEEIADKSIAQSLARTINSSITTLLTIGMLYILGVASIREFALPIIVGIIAGTFASIFLCAPLWVVMKNANAKRKRKKASKR